MRAKNSHSYDISLGQKIRFRRNMMGFSQKQLGSHLGVTFQQIQKYEKGLNRVSAARLQEIADVLKVPVSFFYAESTKKEEISSHFNDRISSKAEYLLLKNFRELTRKKQRAILLLISDEKKHPLIFMNLLRCPQLFSIT
ncbi:helix-turn-helix transcriptional regulator [Bartonella krasnovii]|uniref:helix-turn-helix domain-containing protein n=1 Tax=Bartonella krasnovii TaxID=2267275 RepID=UPI001F4D1192|nr:helix-turn-helix transcriptional regulator [Bartonella krasnovii]UNF45006.1 helix-turn-helix transcriptional regulator [Bartonella krasnovii]UNF51584.1 helix-turn-helix transcriptional regulator [Bartonella krasnovii]